MNQEFPQIKVKSGDVINIERVRRLRKDLRSLDRDILLYAPSNFNYKKLRRLRIRIFRFPRKEECGELFIINGNRRYVCLDASMVNNPCYYSSLQYMLHGIAHSFCFLKDDVAEETFCEFVSYQILNMMLARKGKRFSRKIINSLRNCSTTEYNNFLRAANRLEKKHNGIIVKLNNMAKNRKISKKKQKRIFYKLLKIGKPSYDGDPNDVPELERGFRKIV